MLVANYMPIKPEMSHSRTYEDFYKFLGTNPKMMGVVARMNSENTATFLTEGLMNIYHNTKTVNKFQPINSMQVDWDIEVDFIKQIEFAAVPNSDGARGSDIVMYFTERYYERYDTFVIEGSGQQCIVKAVPQRRADNYWEYIVQLLESDYEAVLDLDHCQVGDLTRFISNVMPEYHSEGYVKYQSNVQKHRTWLKESRVDIEMSSRFDAFEDQFISISKGEKSSPEYKERIFKLNKAQKDLLDSFQTAKNQGMLWDKSTMDANGKSYVQDEQGRPLIQGDGLIPQFQRFASKMKYAKLDISVFNTVMDQMTDKSVNPTGNHWVFAVNSILWRQINQTLIDWLKSWNSVPTAMYSKADGKVQELGKGVNALKVGGTFTTYEIAGNTITFIVDKALSKAYPTKGWGICMDLTPDMSTSQPAIAAFTLPGKEFVSNTLVGVGFKDGQVSTKTAGSAEVLSGYYGIAAFRPFQSFVLSQN